jgi:flavorubredoxin
MARQDCIEIANSIFWVGSEMSDGLQCNPYLILDDQEAVLIDPGSVLDFDAVYNNIVSLTGLENIKYVVLSHQDPDLCASMPLFERRGLKAKIVTHWRASVLHKYYGMASEFYLVNDMSISLNLNQDAF